MDLQGRDGGIGHGQVRGVPSPCYVLGWWGKLVGDKHPRGTLSRRGNTWAKHLSDPWEALARLSRAHHAGKLLAGVSEARGCGGGVGTVRLLPRRMAVSVCSVAGGSLSKQDWTIQWPTTEPGKENSPGCQPEPGQWGRTHLSQSPKVQPKCGQHHCHVGSPHGPMYTHVDRLTVEGHPGLCPPVESGHRSLPPSPRQRHAAHTPPRTPNIVTTMTPPGTPPVRRRNKLKPPGTPPPSSRKLIHLIPGFTALHRSKSHEFQLGHRVDEAHTPK